MLKEYFHITYRNISNLIRHFSPALRRGVVANIRNRWIIGIEILTVCMVFVLLFLAKKTK